MKPCPICKAANLRPHCPHTNPVCTWTRCPNCSAVLDLRRRRGYDKKQAPILWPRADDESTG